MNTLNWFKSSYSSDQGGACLEVALEWRKSSHSSNEGGNCVEVANCPGTVHVRDSKNVDGPRLTFDAVGWAAFLAHTAGR